MQIAMLGNVISALAAMNSPLQLRLATRFQPIRREGIFTEQRNNSDARKRRRFTNYAAWNPRCGCAV